MHKPATTFTAAPDGDFTERQHPRYDTPADREARQARWERTKINIASLVIGITLSAYFFLITLLAGAFD